ncbi:hypothetical protein BB561_002752 [Smittium simulii]|uniref:Uncharacterized protein n=1 Tax=Smittium simulii TaxID=133385 RepID=A0A2T9YPE0_9FUNG|nr:hypothetical protein BB561_002752 [Smittium simulii]
MRAKGEERWSRDMNMRVKEEERWSRDMNMRVKEEERWSRDMNIRSQVDLQKRKSKNRSGYKSGERKGASMQRVGFGSAINNNFDGILVANLSNVSFRQIKR